MLVRSGDWDWEGNNKNTTTRNNKLQQQILETNTWPGRIPQLTCESKVNVDIKKKRHRPHQHVSHSSSRGVKKNGEQKLMCQLEQNPQEAGLCRLGSRGGGGRKLTISKVQHFALLYMFWLGTDLDLPLYGSPLNPITISFHDYTIIFSLSNGIKTLEPPKRPFLLIHSQPKNGFFRSRTHFFAIFRKKTRFWKTKKNASRPCG